MTLWTTAKRTWSIKWGVQGLPPWVTLWSVGWPWGSCQAPELQGAAMRRWKRKCHDENPKKGRGATRVIWSLDSFHDPWGHPWVHRVKENVPPIYLTFCCLLFWMSAKTLKGGQGTLLESGTECQVDNFVPNWYYPKYILQAGAALAHVCWIINYFWRFHLETSCGCPIQALIKVKIIHVSPLS
jgi:hypothetical protein